MNKYSGLIDKNRNNEQIQWAYRQQINKYKIMQKKIIIK